MHCLKASRTRGARGSIFSYDNDSRAQALRESLADGKPVMCKSDIKSFYPRVTPDMVVKLADRGVPVTLIDRTIKWMPPNIDGPPQGYELSDMVASMVLAPSQAEIFSLGIECRWLNDDMYICARTRLEAAAQVWIIAELLDKNGLEVAADKTELSEGLDAFVAVEVGHRGGIDFGEYFEGDPFEHEASSGEAGSGSFGRSPYHGSALALNWERLILCEFLAKTGLSESVLREAIRSSRSHFVAEHASKLSSKYPAMVPNILKALPVSAQLDFCLGLLRRAESGPWPDGRLIELLSTVRSLNGPSRGSSELVKLLSDLAISAPAEAAVNCHIGGLKDSRLAARVATKLSDVCSPDLWISRIRAMRAIEKGFRRDIYDSVRGTHPVLDQFIRHELTTAA